MFVLIVVLNVCIRTNWNVFDWLCSLCNYLFDGEVVWKVVCVSDV